MSTDVSTSEGTKLVAERWIGRFFWRDLMTTDPERAKAFYTSLFGWTINSVPMPGDAEGTYDMVALDGESFGGINQLDSAAGAASHWVPYIVTPDVDATAAQAAKIGGTVVMEPMDIPGIGRFAVVADPSGAVFQPMTAYGRDNDPPSGQPPAGGVIWNELWTPDAPGAVTFYQALFGYGTREEPMGDAETYRLLSVKGDNGPDLVAGVMQSRSPEMPTQWITYVRVEQIEAAQRRIEELGGQNVGPIITVEGTGRVASAIDPTGALFAILEAEPM